MDKKCDICGRENINILCSKCGTFICERCYDVEKDQCIKCSGKKIIKSSPNNQLVYLIGGFLLVMMGLFVTSFAFIPLTNAKIIVFPFVFENVSSITAVLMSLMFFTMFAATSLLPLYISLQKSKVYEWDEGIYTLNENKFMGGNVTETIEYMITTEVPETLKDTIFLEDNLNEIILLSEKDNGFNRSYSIPDQFIIDSIESAYEDEFLVLKVKLVRG
ncbi:MAG: B-box zinc finger protein [Candidatus Bathyarchaeota archaeon]